MNSDKLQIFKIKKSGEISSVYSTNTGILKEPSSLLKTPKSKDINNDIWPLASTPEVSASTNATKRENPHTLRKENESLRHDLESERKTVENLRQELKLVRQAKDANTPAGFWSSLKDGLLNGKNNEDESKGKSSDDLKRIKIKEREFENKYELLRRDTQTLLNSKDEQILELKEKLDATEIESESLEERLRDQIRVLNEIEGKKKRLIETLKLAITLLEEIDQESIRSTSDKANNG